MMCVWLCLACHLQPTNYEPVYGIRHIYRKSSLYLPLGSVTLAMGTPGEISSPPGWNRVSPGCPRNFNTKLTEPTRQIKTTFPMNIGERIMRGCTSAVWRDCNMIELVHAKSTHTYATTRRLSGMHVGRASVMLSVFQFFRFVWASWRREGYWIPPKTCNSGRLHNLRWETAQTQWLSTYL